MWHRDDKMPEARAMNLAVFLDDVNEFNGPLYLIPRSHKKGVVAAAHTIHQPPVIRFGRCLMTLSANSLKKAGLSHRKDLQEQAFFDGCLAHGSPPNMSPWGREIIYVTYNHCDNAIQQYKRAEYSAHRDFTPPVPLKEDCLMNLLVPL